jgi:glycosyltransferase involved in cell wall biosynthesis
LDESKTSFGREVDSSALAAGRKVVASVVVPTRNRCDKIARCLQGLSLQSQSDFEVLVIDDGSTDATAAFLAEYSMPRPDVQLRTYRNDPAQGANPSRNLGVRESRGEYVAFLDDDCFPDPSWLERMLAAFESEEVAAVTGQVDNVAPRNIYELTLKGTHRVHGDGHATRLVAGNLCARRFPRHRLTATPTACALRLVRFARPAGPAVKR